MAKVDDVAAYILKTGGAMSAMKLQKLAYYSQAWHLAWDGVPLFSARIEAWANGPVVPKLYAQHRGQYQLSRWASGKSSGLSATERGTVDAVVGHYGKKSATFLSELTHSELPWREARDGMAPGERGQVEISKETMQEYYGGLIVDGDEI